MLRGLDLVLLEEIFLCAWLHLVALDVDEDENSVVGMCPRVGLAFGRIVASGAELPNGS